MILYLLIMSLGCDASMSEYTIDLDKNPYDRWTHIMPKYTDDIKQLIDTALNELPYMFSTIVKYFGRNYFNTIPLYIGDYGKEIMGISNITNIQLYEITIYNIFYEIFSLCTSSIINIDDYVIHGRNLDFGLFMNGVVPILKRLSIDVKFVRNNKVIYQAHTFAGYVGIFTGMKPYRYSITINQRFILNGGYMGIFRWFYNMKPKWNSFIVRDILEGDYTYYQAAEILQKIELVSPIYYIIAGTEYNQGLLITRNRYYEEKPLYLNSTSYLIQTNHDHWEKPYYFDDRITPAIRFMNKYKHTYDNMLKFLSTKPILNILTIYSSIMIPKINKMFGMIQNCSHPCPGMELW